MSRRLVACVLFLLLFSACTTSGAEAPPPRPVCPQGRCCAANDAVSLERARDRQEAAAGLAWCITAALATGLMVGLVKMGLDLRRNLNAVVVPKEPWDRSWD